ncbi:MAG TPA: hypothetical protein PLD23_17745 [Armatimonadota bacterium]|nr:hypothetical protein [Armatimonadota bacterium]
MGPRNDEQPTRDDEGRPEGASDLIERLARRVVGLHMAPPAIFVLESTKPLTFIASQALIVFEPIVQAVFSFREYREFQRLMEDRANVERLIDRIEDLEDARVEAERAERRARREARRKGDATGTDEA